MLVVFDLDGVLLDTNDIIRQGYRLAGVDPPEDVLGSEGTDWLERQVGTEEAANIRARKSQYYLDAIAAREPNVLPPFVVAQWLYASGYRLWILTGAPPGTANELVHYYARKPRIFEGIIDNIRAHDKMNFIKSFNEPGVYVDDQDNGNDLRSDWRFIHYQGENEETFAASIMDETHIIND